MKSLTLYTAAGVGIIALILLAVATNAALGALMGWFILWLISFLFTFDYAAMWPFAIVGGAIFGVLRSVSK